MYTNYYTSVALDPEGSTARTGDLEAGHLLGVDLTVAQQSSGFGTRL
jgi:hypothetical protein